MLSVYFFHLLFWVEFCVYIGHGKGRIHEYHELGRGLEHSEAGQGRTEYQGLGGRLSSHMSFLSSRHCFLPFSFLSTADTRFVSVSVGDRRTWLSHHWMQARNVGLEVSQRIRPNEMDVMSWCCDVAVVLALLLCLPTHISYLSIARTPLYHTFAHTTNTTLLHPGLHILHFCRIQLFNTKSFSCPIISE